MSGFKRRAPALAASALALSVLFAGAARAQDEQQVYQCTDASGQQVSVIRGALAQGHTGAYSDYYGAKQPMIIYDPKWMEGATLATRRLTMGHECTHHRLGHLAKSFDALQHGQPLSFEEQKQMEFDADCGAMQEGKEKYGYGKAEAIEFYEYIQKTVPPRYVPLIQEREERGLQCPAFK